MGGIIALIAKIRNVSQEGERKKNVHEGYSTYNYTNSKRYSRKTSQTTHLQSEGNPIHPNSECSIGAELLRASHRLQAAIKWHASFSQART